jgi:ABC-type multidrug transport system fused ATPase/permease subunit
LERYYDPTGGNIKVGGYDLKDLNLSSFRQRVGYVGQEPVLFNQTIRENIKYGKPEATDTEIFTALCKANAAEIV